MPDEHEALRAENARLRDANETMREFVATAAHEMRGPAAAVLGFAKTILSRWDRLEDDDKRDYLGIIVRRSRYLSRLLDSLLTLSKIEANALDVHSRDIAMREAVAQALEDLEEGEHVVKVDCEHDAVALADPDHVHRILVNFLTNAVKYGAPPITVSVDGSGDGITVVVSDEGAGVPEELSDRLFDRFTRADDVDGDRGTGLGLSIVRGLARANGGDAWYEPNQPRGSRFGISLPEAR